MGAFHLTLNFGEFGCWLVLMWATLDVDLFGCGPVWTWAGLERGELRRGRVWTWAWFRRVRIWTLVLNCSNVACSGLAQWQLSLIESIALVLKVTPLIIEVFVF